VVAIRSLTNQTVLAQSSASHHDLATRARTDSLTGLNNRAAFDAALAEGLACSPGWLALLMLDLDDFKIVNGLGHSAGDELLRHLARRLRSAVREQDLCARLGGDEFAVLLTAPEQDALAIAQRLVDLVAAPVSLHGQVTHVGVSVGVAHPAPGATADELVQHADAAGDRRGGGAS
jgi:diguanylate cyclase (GGDEF)-like protein